MIFLSRYSLIGALVIVAGMRSTARASDRGENALPDASARFSSGDASPIPQEPWWSAFQSDELNQLMEKALTANPDLETARSQARQATAIAATGVTAFTPSVYLDAQLGIMPSESMSFGQVQPSYDDLLTPLYEALSQMGIELDSTETPADDTTLSDTIKSGSAAATVSLPIDLWGAGVQNWHAGRWDARAATATVDALRLTITTSVARTWLDLVTSTARVEIVSAQIQSSEDILVLTEMRHTNGETNALEVLQQRQQVASTRTLLPQARTLQRIAQQQLAVLLGESPTQPRDAQTRTLPTLPVQPPIGTPTQLAQRSPTVLVALAQLTAAQHREAATIRSMLPALSASASYGPQFYNYDGENWESDSYWSVGLSANMAIFKSGSAVHGVRATRAGADAAGHQLESTVLSAIQRVENALIMESEQQRQFALAQEMQDAAQAAMAMALQQYRSGLINHIPVISAQQSALSAALSLLQASRDLLDSRIQLHAALGSVASPDGETQ